MAFYLARADGQTLTLRNHDWSEILEAAADYGWRPHMAEKHYALNDAARVSDREAEEIADALERAISAGFWDETEDARIVTKANQVVEFSRTGGYELQRKRR